MYNATKQGAKNPWIFRPLLPIGQINYRLILNAFTPGNCAATPSSSSMRRSWLYFCYTLTSARCAGLDLAGIQCNRQVCDCGVLCFAGAVGRDGGVAPALWAILMASKVSDTVPIWFNLIRMETCRSQAQCPWPDARCWLRTSHHQPAEPCRPALLSSSAILPSPLHPDHPQWSRSGISHRLFQCSTSSFEVNFLPLFGSRYSPFLLLFHSLEAASIARTKSVPGL